MRITFQRFRVVVLVTVGCMAAVAPGQAQAAAAKPSEVPVLQVPARVVDELARRQASGWKLTEFGSLVMARVPVRPAGSIGQQLLATTDDAAVATRGMLSESAAASPKASALLSRAGVRCPPLTKRSRSLAMTAGAGFVCNWGQRANIQWTSQYGYAHTRFTYQDPSWNYSTQTVPGYCYQQGCFWHSYTNPNEDRRVTFGEVESQYYARIDNTWCG